MSLQAPKIFFFSLGGGGVGGGAGFSHVLHCTIQAGAFYIDIVLHYMNYTSAG